MWVGYIQGFRIKKVVCKFRGEVRETPCNLGHDLTLLYTTVQTQTPALHRRIHGVCCPILRLWLMEP